MQTNSASATSEAPDVVIPTLNPRRRGPLRLVDLPDVLTIEEVAAVYRITVYRIRKALGRGDFRPAPIARYPARWRKEDIEADLRERGAAADALERERQRHVRQKARARSQRATDRRRRRTA